MPLPLVLYSTNTRLAHMIAKSYYADLHYVWCSPFAGSFNAFDRIEPPSSSPLKIYRSLHDDVSGADLHSDKIRQNRNGLIRGASTKRQAGVIDEATERGIVATVERAETSLFQPWLYIIPYAAIQGIVKPAPLEQRAHPFSEEYIIEELPRARFDIVELPL